MATVTRKTLRRQLGGVLKVRGKKALAATFLPTSGTTTTSIHAAVLGAFPNEASYFNGARLSVVAGTNSGATRAVTSFAQSTGTLTHGAFASAQDTTSDSELWRFGLDADVVNDSITLAIQEVDTSALVYTQSTLIATEAGRYEYPMPSGLEWLYGVEIAAKAPLLGYAASNRKTGRGLFNGVAAEKLAQQIVFASDETVWGYALHLDIGAGSPSGTLTVTLETSSSGLPSGVTVSGSTATLAATSVPAVSGHCVFRLSTPIRVSAGTYHLVLDTSASVDANNYVRWSEDNDSPSYTDGTLELYNGATWSEVSGSVVVFQVLSDPAGDWVRWPASGWHIIRDATTQLSLVHRPPLAITDFGYTPEVCEGRPVRLLGYRDADAPTSDSSTIEASPNFILAVAITYLLQGMEQEEVERDLQYWQRKVEMMRAQQPVRTRLLPNAVRVRDSY